MGIIEAAKDKIKSQITDIEDRTDLTDEQKQSQIIHIFSVTCAAVAIQPIPFADIFVLTPIQAYMGERLSAIRGMPLSEAESTDLLKEIAGIVGIGLAAQQIALGFYKAGLPGLGGFTTIPLVYGLTYAIGRIMDYYLEKKSKGQAISNADLKNMWAEYRKEGMMQANEVQNEIITRDKELQEIPQQIRENKETIMDESTNVSKIIQLVQEYKNLSTVDQFEWLGTKTIEIAGITNNRSQPIQDVVDNGKRMLLAAQESFRLGVIGEFRVGKSTLINALLGQEIAFTDIMEATSAECVFHFSDENHASINFKDGSTEVMSIQEMNDALDDNRENKVWLNKIDNISYAVNSERLTDFDLWDAPGLGGSDDNERLANRFLEKLGGAVWVIDITLIGKSSINRPLAHLKKTGKPIIGVLNRIDEYEGDIDEAIKFVHKTYPGVFTQILSMSALDAIDIILEGGTSNSIEELWSTVLSTFGKDQQQGSDARIKKTLEALSIELAQNIGDVRRAVQDQIGLCEHLRYNLESEQERLLQNLPSIVRDHADRAFDAKETEIWKDFDSISSTPENHKKAIEHIMADLSHESTYIQITQKVNDKTTEQISSEWFKSTREALNLSRTALAISSHSYIERMGEKPVSKVLSDPSVDFENLSQEAYDDGLFAGGVTAVVASTVAIVSVSVSWPVILAALPISALFAWKKQREVDRSENGMGGQIKQVLNKAKTEFLSEYLQEIERELRQAFDKEIENIMLRKISEVVGVEDPGVLEDSLVKLEFFEQKLGMGKKDEKASIPPKALLDKLSHVGNRLDIVLTETNQPLVPILSRVPPDTSIRLILVANKKPNDLENVVKNCFGNWQGKKKARAVICDTSPFTVGLSGMLITSEFAVQTDSSLANLSDQNMIFTPYEQGRLAAQRLFALLWEGKPITSTSESVDLIQLY